MKSSKIATLSAGLALMLGLTGCAGTKPLPPKFYGSLAHAAVKAAFYNSPNTAADVETLAQALCQATQDSDLSPTAFVHAVPTQNLNSDVVVIADLLQALYAGVYYSLSDTNQVKLKPYVEQIFCVSLQGITPGQQMTARMRNGPPIKSVQDIQVPRYRPDPKFPFSVK